MNWVNLEVRTLRSPEYIGSSPTERATWLNVLAYCCEQENGGCIEGASEWKDRQWQQVCGVTLREVKSANKLLKWESGRLVVVFYPVAKEIEVQAKREAGRAGGIQKAKQFASTATSSASSTPDNSASTERKGKEGEGEVIAGTATPPADDKPKKPRKEPSGDHAKFIRLWTEAYPEHHDGNAYLFQAGKDGSAVQHLVKGAGKTPEQIMEVAIAAWKNPLGFYSKLSASLSSFSSQFNNIQTEISTRALELEYHEPTPRAFSAPMNKPPERPAHLK